jgi:predicted metal-binding membrane protein
VLAGLIGISALAWVYTIALADHGHGHGHAMHAAAMAHVRPWTATDLAMTFVMWSVMMVAMMVPTAVPMILAMAQVSRAQASSAGPVASTTAFLLGYLIIWTAFSFVGTLAQWWLHQVALVSAAGASTSAVFGGSLLLGAGVFQLTPLKDACLSHCRSPVFFLVSAWRPGTWGALRMGIHHGAFCVGCCWALMLLMFVAGMMNLLWAAALMLLMLAEKALPLGRRLSHVAGMGFAAWGLYLLGMHWIRA